MAYGLKYWNEFKNYYDETIRVEILGRDYDGSDTEIKTLATPLILSYPGDDNNLFNPIIGSQATINILSETNFQFIDLHSSDARAHRVDIYKESVLDWTGWILPDLFSEPYIAPPYPVSITARCGLGELKESEINSQNSIVNSLSETPTLYSIIKSFLLSIETITTLNDAVNVFYDSNDTENDSPLVLTKINISAFEGKSPYDAISEILLSFGARLYQMSGEWWIVRAKEMRDTLTVRKFNLTDNTFVVDNSKLTTFLISRPAQSQIVNESPQLDILPAWKKFNWIQDLGKLESFIPNSNFQDWTDNPVVYGVEITLNPLAQLIYWNSVGTGIGPFSLLAVRRFDRNGEPYCLINSYDKNNYIFQNIALDEAGVNQSLKFAITFDLFSIQESVSTGTFNIEIKNFGASDTYYLKINSLGQTEWTTTPTKIIFENVSVSNPRISGDGRVENFRTHTIIAPNPPVNGFIVAKIFACEQALLMLSQFSGKLITSDETEYISEINTEVVINNLNIYSPDDIEISCGDLPEVTNASLIWENGYRKDNGIATVKWHERDSATELPILQLIGEDYKAIFQTPQFKLTVPILSQTIQFDSCIVDYLVLYKKYICASAEIDYQTCIFSGTYMEFGQWEDAIWILADGTWNDNGIWMDDETWNDDDGNTITVEVSGLGYHDISHLVNVGDIVETLPVSAPGMNVFLYDDGSVILSAPYEYTGTQFKFLPDPIALSSFQNQFNMTISGVLKTIKIIVTL